MFVHSMLHMVLNSTMCSNRTGEMVITVDFKNRPSLNQRRFLLPIVIAPGHLML